MMNMRVTSEAVVARSLDRLNSRLRAYERAQDSLSSGRRFQVASDDPSAAHRSLQLRHQMRAAEQHLRNADDAASRLSAADQQLSSALTRLQRVRELAVAAGSSSGPTQRGALAAEIREIAGEIAGAANTEHLGQSLFGGFAQGDVVSWDAGASRYTVAGSDDDEVVRRVEDHTTVRVNVTAASWLGATGAGDHILNQLLDLADAVENATPSTVSALIAELDTSMDRVGHHLATVGAKANTIAAARSRVDSRLLALRTELSTLEDVDLAHGIMELETQQLAYQATLQALSRALPPSLASFLN